MQNSLPKKIQSYMEEHSRFRRWSKLVTILACVVVFCTTYALILPAVTMTSETYCGKEAHTHNEECYERELICTLGSDEDIHEHTDACYEPQLVLACGQEEGPEHTHTTDCYRMESVLVCTEGEGASGAGTHQHRDTCYKETLICGKEEHQHTLLCYSNPEADLETADIWERTLPAALSGNWANDLIAVAESQLGYHESTNNYILDEGGYIHGHTRYGAWYGSPYGDWCAMFASFCLHYAGIPERAFPYEAGCTRWVELLTQAGLYTTGAPERGALAFFDKNADGLADHVGIVTAVSDDGFQTIEGNLGKAVVSQTHSYADGEVLGYGLLPNASEEPETPEDTEKQPLCGLEEHVHDESCFDESGALTCTLSEHTHTESCYEAAKQPLCGLEEHTHDESCYDESGALICTLPEHTHTESCYEAAKKPLCGLEEHIHDESCYDESGALICALSEHTHTESCYEAAKQPLCGLEEHIHDESCYDESGALTCTLSEHTHTDACYQAVGLDTYEFSYADSQLSLRLYVESPISLESAELQLTPVSQSEAQLTEMLRTANAADDEEPDASGEWILRQLALTQDGETLDTSAFTMTADITLTRSALAPVEAELSVFADAAPEAEPAISVSVMQEDETQSLRELDSASIAPGEASPVLHAAVQSGLLAVNAATANPTYIVQYYANLPRFVKDGEQEASGLTPLKVFDTSGNALPKNNEPNPVRNIYLEAVGRNTTKNAGVKTPLYKVATKNELTQMYTDNTFQYIKAPNPSYIDKLTENSSYTLEAVWVLKEDKSADSTNSDDWDQYGTDVHFTNRSDVADANKQVVYIHDSTVIRLIYDCATASQKLTAAFYDYDITGGIKGSNTWYTNKADGEGALGINSKTNYPAKSANNETSIGDAKEPLAFGNANTGTGMANYKFAGVYLNQYSKKAGSGQSAYDVNYGCTFGLADHLENGKIVYNPYLLVPDLFNESTAKGKKTYDNSHLIFSQVGDTYTLSSAEANGLGSISELEYFFNPSPTPEKTHGSIFTNDFWPLDTATDRSDPNFGSYSDPKYYYYGVASLDNTAANASKTTENNSFPYSDDGQAHNSFFGMQYAVEFTLTEDYVGPLEYYFFGDDDMWVFLDNTLVCDIGGVHSSVGEYVNLWDYLKKGDAGEHTLSFFYTERGASGSTCYMSFTLPSVSGINIEQKTADLKITKAVVGESDPTKEFRFEIHFTDKDGNEILDDYSYTKTDRSGSTTDDLILHEGSEFTLKDGESIHIKYLPIGLLYTVKELDSTGYTVTNTVNGVVSSGGTASGTVIKDVQSAVVFTNTIGRVGLTLQKLDQDGESLNGAVFQLKNANGDVMNFIRKDEKTYVVPTGSADYIDLSTAENPRSGSLYYIASAAHPEYVIGQASAGSHQDAKLQKKSGQDTQKYYVYQQADGSYSFQSNSNGEWLDLDENQTANSTLVHFWDNPSIPTTSSTQEWYLIVNSDGSFKFKPRAAVLNKSKAVLDLNGANFAEGGRIQVYEDNGSAAQKWILVPVDPASAPKTTDQLEVTSGGIRLDGLMPGDYTLTEVTTPEGFKALDKPVKFHVDASGKIRLASDSSSLAAVNEGGVILNVTNLASDRKLTLKKLVTRSDTKQKFDFTISYELDGKTVEKTLSLANGGEGTLDIPYGVEVTITEPKHDGYTLTFTQENTTLASGGSSCTIEKMTQDVTIVATNEAGYALPETGGAGTIWFTIGGLLLTAGGLLYGCTLRRRHERRFF